VGLVRGKAGIQEYTDAAVNDPAVKRVRELARAEGDASISEDQAHVFVETVDGRRVEKFVEESLGNLRRPLSDAQLGDKFRDQAIVNLPASVVDALLRQCWMIDQLDDVGTLVEASRPAGAVRTGMGGRAGSRS
jgi:2-methylcitrate dehydratase PrpD